MNTIWSSVKQKFCSCKDVNMFFQALHRQNVQCNDLYTYLSHKCFRLLSGILKWILFLTDSCGNENIISTWEVPLRVSFSSACNAHNHPRSSCDNWYASIEQSKNFWRRKWTDLVVLTVPLHSNTGRWIVDSSSKAFSAPRHTRNPL